MRRSASSSGPMDSAPQSFLFRGASGAVASGDTGGVELPPLTRAHSSVPRKRARQPTASASGSLNDGGDAPAIPQLASIFAELLSGSNDGVRAAERRLATFQKALTNLPGHRRQSRSFERQCSLLWSLLIMLVLAIVIIVMVYLFSQGNTATGANSFSVREICNSENVDLCLQGLREQLRDDTTAALRSPIHYIFTFAAFLFTLSIYTCSQNRKLAARRRILSALPNESIDLWTGARRDGRRPYQRRPFNKEMHKALTAHLNNAQIARSAEVSYAAQVASRGTLCPQDPNWHPIDRSHTPARHGGDAGARPEPQAEVGDARWMNRKRYAAQSYLLVEALAVRLEPHLAMRSWETVRDYMARLQASCNPPLDAGRCDELVQFYEEARFSSAPVGPDRWDKVVQNADYFFKRFQT